MGDNTQYFVLNYVTFAKIAKEITIIRPMSLHFLNWKINKFKSR